MQDLTYLARPYAKALFANALDAGKEEHIYEELKTMSLVFSQAEIQHLIESPKHSNNETAEEIYKLLKGEITDLTKNLLFVLAENDRLELAVDIFMVFENLLADHKQKLEVSVSLPVELNDKKTNELKDLILKKYGSSSTVNFIQEPAIMGGIKVKINDEILDLSVRGKIQKIINKLNI
tara:strand:- start:1236 stop:1772 length:537 start_codon:yes stop_codon:yes gene_type:complete